MRGFLDLLRALRQHAAAPVAMISYLLPPTSVLHPPSCTLPPLLIAVLG